MVKYLSIATATTLYTLPGEEEKNLAGKQNNPYVLAASLIEGQNVSTCKSALCDW